MLCTATRLGPPRCPTNHKLRDSPSSPLALLSSSLPSLLLPLNSAGLLGLEYKQSPTRTCVCVCAHGCANLQGALCTHEPVFCVCTPAYMWAGVHACMHGGAYVCKCALFCVCTCKWASARACMHARCLVCTRACLFCAHEPRACVPVCIRAGMCMHAPV